MDSQRRVVITGVGAVTPIGIGKEAFWEALKEGKSGVRPITRFDASIFPSSMAGEVLDFDAADYMPAKVKKRTDRSTHFAIAATQMAIKDANLEIDDHLKEEMPVIIGTAMSGHVSYIEQLRVYFTQGYKKVSPFAAVSCFADACSGQLNIFFGLNGPAETICAGCSSSTNALIESFKRIRLGETDVVIAGGTDAPLSEEIFCGFSQARVLSKYDADTPRPFDLNRDGTVLSEGAGMMILEEYEHAKKRGAHIYAEISGYGMTTDAYQMAGADPSGSQRVRAIKQALKLAEIEPEDIDYINAHGTGTVQNDANETAVLHEVFGDALDDIAISSVKSMIGHAQGASGAMEIIASLLAFEENVIPPTINYEKEDPKCDLNYTVNQKVEKETRYLLKNSFAFGGKNSILVLKNPRFGD